MKRRLKLLWKWVIQKKTYLIVPFSNVRTGEMFWLAEDKYTNIEGKVCNGNKPLIKIIGLTAIEFLTTNKPSTKMLIPSIPPKLEDVFYKINTHQMHQALHCIVERKVSFKYMVRGVHKKRNVLKLEMVIKDPGLGISTTGMIFQRGLLEQDTITSTITSTPNTCHYKLVGELTRQMITYFDPEVKNHKNVNLFNYDHIELLDVTKYKSGQYSWNPEISNGLEWVDLLHSKYAAPLAPEISRIMTRHTENP